ncbi:FtsL-like putative cell division protein [Cloacibacterium sp.]|uniref:FtsL-like putative cell division protein n=1 Tax=Cloacibacterium sp. TaxID=1913682 RepID=UPI0035B365B9
MAKRVTYNKPKKKLTFLDIVKGNFLNRDEVKVHYKYFLLIFALMMIMIYSNHLVSKKIERVNQLKEQAEEFKSRNAYAQSRLIKVKMESELSKEMEGDSLVSLDNHPHKLLIKLDSIEDGNENK